MWLHAALLLTRLSCLTTRDINGVWQAFRDYLESPTSAADASLARLTDRLREVKVVPLPCRMMASCHEHTWA